MHGSCLLLQLRMLSAHFETLTFRENYGIVVLLLNSSNWKPYNCFHKYSSYCVLNSDFNIYLLRLFCKEESLVEFGLIETAADDCRGTVICSTMVQPPLLQQLAFPCHVFSEGFKAGPEGNSNLINHLSTVSPQVSHVELLLPYVPLFLKAKFWLEKLQNK